MYMSAIMVHADVERGMSSVMNVYDFNFCCSCVGGNNEEALRMLAANLRELPSLHLLAKL